MDNESEDKTPVVPLGVAMQTVEFVRGMLAFQPMSIGVVGDPSGWNEALVRHGLYSAPGMSQFDLVFGMPSRAALAVAAVRDCLTRVLVPHGLLCLLCISHFGQGSNAEIDLFTRWRPYMVARIPGRLCLHDGQAHTRLCYSLFIWTGTPFGGTTTMIDLPQLPGVDRSAIADARRQAQHLVRGIGE